MTDPPMYNVAGVVFCRSLTIVRSFPLPGCAHVRYFFIFDVVIDIYLIKLT